MILGMEVLGCSTHQSPFPLSCGIGLDGHRNLLEDTRGLGVLVLGAAWDLLLERAPRRVEGGSLAVGSPIVLGLRRPVALLGYPPVYTCWSRLVMEARSSRPFIFD